MKVSRFLRRTVKVVSFTILALILLATGVILALYSPWLQETGRRKVVEMMNSRPGVSFRLDSFRLRFPLVVDLRNLCFVSDGDTIAAAGMVHADIDPLPLLDGNASVRTLLAHDARYTMGSPDSAMYMKIKAGRIGLRPATVNLGNMGIELTEADLDDGRVDLVLSPDTTSNESAPSEPSSMVLKASKLNLNGFAFSMRMLPVIDSLGADIAQATVSNAVIDLQKQLIEINSFNGTRLGASYIA
ncbi:MAG: hypothetical protein K2L80_01155, partial [Muribaculaceae bacterium]|nr:hypothetical protein [Muribaculaceae bacterium]